MRPNKRAAHMERLFCILFCVDVFTLCHIPSTRAVPRYFFVVTVPFADHLE